MQDSPCTEVMNQVPEEGRLAQTMSPRGLEAGPQNACCDLGM